MTAISASGQLPSLILTRLLARPLEAYLLPVSGFPVPPVELEPVKTLLRKVTARLIEMWRFSLEVFIQFENLQLAQGTARLCERARFWMPTVGLGVWPSRPAPTLWTRADFQDLDVGQKPRPLMHKVFRLTTLEGRTQAPDIMLGRGTVMELLMNGGAGRLLSASRELLLPPIQEPLLRGFPFHVPLLDGDSVKGSKDGQLRRWLCSVSVYIRESPEDQGILLISDRPMAPVLSAIGGEPDAAGASWQFR
jgi:hypothetical protein